MTPAAPQDRSKQAQERPDPSAGWGRRGSR